MIASKSGTDEHCGAPSEQHSVRCCSSMQLPGYVQSADRTCGDLWYSSQFSCADATVPCQYSNDGYCDEPGGFMNDLCG